MENYPNPTHQKSSSSQARKKSAFFWAPNSQVKESDFEWVLEVAEGADPKHLGSYVAAAQLEETTLEFIQSLNGSKNGLSFRLSIATPSGEHSPASDPTYWQAPPNSTNFPLNPPALTYWQPVHEEGIAPAVGDFPKFTIFFGLQAPTSPTATDLSQIQLQVLVKEVGTSVLASANTPTSYAVSLTGDLRKLSINKNGFSHDKAQLMAFRFVNIQTREALSGFTKHSLCPGDADGNLGYGISTTPTDLDSDTQVIHDQVKESLKDKASWWDNFTNGTLNGLPFGTTDYWLWPRNPVTGAPYSTSGRSYFSRDDLPNLNSHPACSLLNP